MRSNVKTAGIGIISALLGLAIYSNTWRSPFVFDDLAAIVTNQALRNPFDWTSILNAFNTRFLTGLTFAANLALGGLDVRGFHAFNLGVHLLSSLLVYGIVQQLFLTATGQREELAEDRRWIGLFAALLFLTHPVQTQAVTYIWQRAASLATCLSLASLWLYAKSRRRFCWRTYLTSWVLASFSMFAKETSVTLPLALMAYELFFGRTPQEPRKSTFFLLLPYFLLLPIIPMMLGRSDSITLPLMQSRVLVNAPHHPSALTNLDNMTRFVDSTQMPRSVYMLTQLNVLREYLRLLVLPMDQNLDYDYPLARSFLEPGVLFSVVLLGAVILWGLRVSKRSRVAGFGLFWYFLTLSVESLIPQSDVIFEHRLYRPLAGSSIFIICAALLFLRKTLSKKGIAFLMGVLVAACSLLTYQRNQVWRSEIALWSDTVLKSPNKFRPLSSLATAYLKTGDLDRALIYFDRALVVKPDSPQALSNRADVHNRQGDHQKALADISRAIELEPDFAPSYLTRALLYEAIGDKANAFTDFDRALELDPVLVPAYVDRGALYVETGEPEKGLQDYERALALDPSVASLHNNMGVLYLRQDSLAKAVESLSRAVELDANYASAYRNRCLAYLGLGEIQKAAEDLEKARALGDRIPPQLEETLKRRQQEFL